MKRIMRSFYPLMTTAAVFCIIAAAQQPKSNVKMVPPVGTGAIDGKSLYMEFCAVCHGKDAKGNGPAAASLKTPPSDLTQMTAKGSRFNDTKLMAILNGDASAGPHGSQDMPVWGKAFSDMSSNLSVAQGRKHALVTYLESLQAK